MPKASDQARRERRRVEARLATSYGWPAKGTPAGDLRLRLAFVLVLVVFAAGIVATELAK